MKLIHTGDLHIGKMISEYTMLDEQRYILNQIVEIAKEEKVDGVILAGDIYDRAIPPSDAVKALNDFLTELSRDGIAIFLVSGNHDSPERLAFGKELLKNQKLYIAAEFSNKVESVTWTDEYGEVNLYLLPFAKPALMRHFGYEGTTYAACINDVMEKLKIDETKRNLLVTHHFVAGGTLNIEEPEAEYPISVGGIDVVDYQCLKKFDYVALGHIHRAQQVGYETIRYSGSPLKYSFSEVDHEKSVVCIELKEKGDVSVKEILLRPMRDLRAIKGTLEKLTNEDVVKACNPDDYLKVTLTDTKEILDPIGKLRCFYPNVCKLILEKNIHHETEIETMAKEMTRRSVIDIFEEFYEKVTDQELDEVSKDTMIDVIEAVGGREE
ncbi:MAG: exonuclease SbcCD subunit D [Velocimicrobium sp.]